MRRVIVSVMAVAFSVSSWAADYECTSSQSRFAFDIEENNKVIVSEQPFKGRKRVWPLQCDIAAQTDEGLFAKCKIRKDGRDILTDYIIAVSEESWQIIQYYDIEKRKFIRDNNPLNCSRGDS